VNRKLVTALELVAIVGLIVLVLWLSGIFKFEPTPAPTPYQIKFATITPAPVNQPSATPSSLPRPTVVIVHPVPTSAATLPPITPAQGHIAFTSTRDGNAEIYSISAEGTELKNLTQNPAEDTLISWSPNGTKLAFFSTRANGWLEIFTMNADGSNVVQLTHSFGTNTAYTMPVNWSPDGKYLLAERSIPWQANQYNRATNLDLISTDGSRVSQIYTTDKYLSQAAFSPDGRYLAVFLRVGSQSVALYTSPFSEQPNFQLVTPACSFAYIWHIIEDHLTCTDGTSFFNISLDTTTRQPVSIVSNSSDYATEMAWSPNGAYLLANMVSWLQNAEPNVQALSLMDPTNGQRTYIYRDKFMLTFSTFTWAPDSQWVTFASQKNGHADIYILNVFANLGTNTLPPLQLTGDAGDNYAPHWQPNP